MASFAWSIHPQQMMDGEGRIDLWIVRVLHRTIPELDHLPGTFMTMARAPLSKHLRPQPGLQRV